MPLHPIVPGMASRVRRYQITIPSSTNLTKRWGDILQDVECPTIGIVGFKVLAKLVDGTTDRPAFVVANPRQGASVDQNACVAGDFTTHGQPIAAGVEYGEPTTGDIASFPRSTGSAFVAQVVVWF